MSESWQKIETGTGPESSTPVQVGSIKVGSHIIIKDCPCKVTDYTASVSSKGRPAKATIVGVDIFTNKKYEEVLSLTTTVLVPIISNQQYEVADVDEDDFVSLVLPNGDLKSDLRLPREDGALYDQLKQLWDNNKDSENNTVYFTVQSAIGKARLVSGRTQTTT